FQINRDFPQRSISILRSCHAVAAIDDDGDDDDDGDYHDDDGDDDIEMLRRRTTGPYPCKIFHDYEHEDVYKGVVIDYRAHVSEQTKECVYSVTHGARPKTAVYVTTFSNEHKQSWSAFSKDKRIYICPANEYTYAWITGHEYVSFTKTVADKRGCVYEKGPQFFEQFPFMRTTEKRRAILMLYAMELNDTLAYMHSKNIQQIGAVCGGLLIWRYVSRCSPSKYGN
ncbi:hypothetical protein T265_15769, partial [Opisthorchis viverrini]